MRESCYGNGSCDECGCKTLPLQMCSKACDGNCYPPLVVKWEWDLLMKPEYTGLRQDKVRWRIDKRNKKFKLINNNGE